MNREHVLSVLYDIALVIGDEVSVRPLLTRTLQRILYHTSFPTGMVFLDLPGSNGERHQEVTLDAAVGDFGFAQKVGESMSVPSDLLYGDAELLDDEPLLQQLQGATRPYGVALRLPIEEAGVMLLLAPRQPSTQLPLTSIFQPVMANLAKAILLCRHNDAYTASLMSERDIAKQSLAISEEKFRSITAAAQDAIIMIDSDGHMAYWNPAAEKTFGYRSEEVLGRDAHKLIAPERYYDAFTQGFERFRQSGTGPVVGTTIEIEGLHKDGSEFPAEISVSALNLDGRWNAVGIVRDISVRKKNELALRRANRALKTLSGCNAILVRTTDEPVLLNDICKLIVESGGYRGAWVGFVEGELQQFLRPVACAGLDSESINALEVDLSDPEIGQRPAAQAFFSGTAQIVQDVANDPVYPTPLAPAVLQDIASTIALPLTSEGITFGVLEVYAAECDAFRSEEVTLLRELADDLAFGIFTLRTRLERQRLEAQEHESAENLQRALLGTIQAVAMTVEKRDPYTAGHQEKVAQLAVAIAQEMGWTEEQVEGVRLGAMIHDIGKIYIPSEILNRPGKLSDIEFDIIRRHPQVGFDIVKDVEFPWPVAQIILQHHERLDGSGYPQHLSADQIIPEARILAVADVVEAIASHRPYRPALELEEALKEIKRYRGRLYDSQVVDACLRVFRERGFSFEHNTY
jgi:PAS domain S-box-containing protein/putative nucleotidyltransferase with HDIG domain